MHGRKQHQTNMYIALVVVAFQQTTPTLQVTTIRTKLLSGTPNTGKSNQSPIPQSTVQNRVILFVRTLKQTCSQDFPRAPLAFKNSMTHEFCKSHYLSQFATFFIDVGAKTSPATGCMSIEVSSIDFCVGRLPFTTRYLLCVRNTALY